MSEDTAQVPGWDEHPPEPTDEPPKPELYYKTLPQFVEEFLVHALWTDVAPTDHIWCPEWWRHIGAIVRLEALWRSWEDARLDATGQAMVAWLRDAADYHLGVLHRKDGPFKGCTLRAHDGDRSRVIPTVPPPDGLFAEGD